MTGLHPETVALLDQVRALHAEAKASREILTLDQVAAAIGRSKGRAQQLWALSGLPPLARGRRPGTKPRKRKPTPRATSGAKGGRSKSPAKAEAARANLEAIRARRTEGVGRRPGPMSKEELAEMNVLELDLRAATATSTREKARWLRRKVARGFTLAPEQAEILEIEGRRKSKIPRKRA